MVSQSPETKTAREAPVRAPSAVPVDDTVLPFEVNALDLRGRLTRLGPALDDILTKHDYPAPVGKLLGEAIVLTTLLGTSLKFEGRFILQTRTDGPVSFLVVDFKSPDRLRAYARFDAKRLKDGQTSGELLGKGHLAMSDWGYACFAQLLGDDIIKSVGQIKLGVTVPSDVRTYRPM